MAEAICVRFHTKTCQTEDERERESGGDPGLTPIALELAPGSASATSVAIPKPKRSFHVQAPMTRTPR